MARLFVLFFIKKLRLKSHGIPFCYVSKPIIAALPSAKTDGADLSHEALAKGDDRIAAPPCKIRPLGEPALFRLFATVRTGCFAGSNPYPTHYELKNAHLGIFEFWGG